MCPPFLHIFKFSFSFVMKITAAFLGLAAAIASVQAAPATSGLAAAPLVQPKTYTLPVQANPQFSRSAKASVWKTANKYKKYVQPKKTSVLASTGSVNMTDVQNDVEVSKFNWDGSIVAS
jgi:hypothetical protein